MDFSELYAVMLEVFAVILLGYTIGRLKLITSQESKGLGRFASLIALPASLFYNMAKLDFSAVDWSFLLGIFLTKTLVFISVAVGCVAVTRRFDVARAGLFAIFATQSNDFAFGLPIFNNLYGRNESGFSLGDYVFLIAPISFIILNPIGFAMMEYGQSKRQGQSRSALKIAWVVCRGVFTNPLVFMAIFGLVVNPIINHKVPSLVEPLLQVLSRAFDGVALFYLGLSMVGKLKALPGLKVIIPIVLITIKLLILPVIADQLVDALGDTAIASTSNTNATSETDDLPSFAFLYGTMPTAPALIFFANHYALEFDLIATSLVLCTFLSAPIIFVSAHMISLEDFNTADLEEQVGTSFLYVSSICTAAIVWVLAMFLLAKRYRRFLHRLDIILISFLFVACMAIVTLPATDDVCPDDPRVVAQFWFQLVGVFGSRVMTAVIAVALVLVYQSGHQTWSKSFPVLAVVGIAVPIVLTTLLVGIGSVDTNGHSSCFNNVTGNNTNTTNGERIGFSHTGAGRFIYGDGQLILSTLLLSACVIVCISSLVKMARLYHQRKKQLNITRTDSQNGISTTEFPSESPVSIALSSINDSESSKSSSPGVNADTDEGRSPLVLRRKGSKLVKTPSFPKAMDIQSDEDRAERESLAFVEMSVDEDNTVPNQQTTRHLLFILYAIVSMLVGVFLLIWRLLNQKTSAVFYELEFMDGALNYGQGLVLFALFGFDNYPVFVALQRRWRRYFYRVETLYVPPPDEVDDETRMICTAFKESHLENCKAAIVTDRRYHLRTYKQVFSGCQMVAWLKDAHIVHDSGEAVDYGRALIRGQVIRHVKGEHDFHDIHYFYQFV